MKKQYPILVHKEEGTAYGVTIPNISGCFTAGDTIEEAIENVQEAVECYYEGKNVGELPTASKIEDLVQNKTLYAEGGFWVLVEVDFSFLSTKTCRINITVPEFKLARIDMAAKKRNLTRSAFLVQAAESSLEGDPNHIF